MGALSQAPPKLDGYIASMLGCASEAAAELDTAALLAFGNALRTRIGRRDFKSIDVDANLVYPSCVVMRCAAGLADLLKKELAGATRPSNCW